MKTANQKKMGDKEKQRDKRIWEIREMRENSGTKENGT